jgi:hypothetical protein
MLFFPAHTYGLRDAARASIECDEVLAGLAGFLTLTQSP